MNSRSDTVSDTQVESFSLHIKGIVQGVGFRPFIYTLARKWGLTGYVLNDSEGVYIEIEGPPEHMAGFCRELRPCAPPYSKIKEIITLPIPQRGFREFTIRESERGRDSFVMISPDLATCNQCLRELDDPSDFRYRYPFINCTNCGPRYTIIEDIPYDRSKTSMKVFPMCPVCRGEFDDPLTRRFHAQPNACASCGPSLSLLNREEIPISTEDPVQTVVSLLREGNIVAIKGLGGFHLAADAMNEEAVRNLRERKYREDKPFALMASDLRAIEAHCVVENTDIELLTSEKRPIVLMKKKKPERLASLVAPRQHSLGFMLPYTPLHHLLLRDSGLVLVMTSGNISDEPICCENREALSRLRVIADYFLMHNRAIHIRCDDSVTRSFEGREIILRRARGYTPAPIEVPHVFRKNILACGAELKSTFALTRENLVFISHHIGDLENLETLLSFEQGIEHFTRLFSIEPELVACDLHPEYLSAKYALAQEEKPVIQIPHHHAHLASCLADNNTEGPAIGVIFDGLGYGEDGTLWGGEFLLGDFSGYERMACFKPMPMPGGTQAIKEPWRLAMVFLDAIYGDALFSLPVPFVKSISREKWKLLKQSLTHGIGSPLTSSAGRLFDAASALMGIRGSIHYEGQAAIELEMSAGDDTDDCYSWHSGVGKDSCMLIDMQSSFREMVDDITEGLTVGCMSKKFHNTMACIVETVCRNIREKSGNSKIALSGGVFQNMLLLRLCKEKLACSGFEVLLHHRVPPNDGGICLGQAMIANAR